MNKTPGGAVGELRRVHECDDGIFNVAWWEYSDYERGSCEYPLTRCDKPADYWCVECGGLTCTKHRKGHMDSRWHDQRMMDLKEPVTDE